MVWLKNQSSETFDYDSLDQTDIHGTNDITIIPEQDLHAKNNCSKTKATKERQKTNFSINLLIKVKTTFYGIQRSLLA